MASRLEKVAAHVLKWAMQPKHRSTSWRRTINDQRRALERLFETNPSLRQLAQTELEKEYRRAVREASDETGFSKEALPSKCPFSFDDAVDENYWPRGVHDGKAVTSVPHLEILRARVSPIARCHMYSTVP